MNRKEELKKLSKFFAYDRKKRDGSEQKEVKSIKPKQEKVKDERKYCIEPLIVQQILVHKSFEIRLKEFDKTLPSTRSKKICLKIPKTVLLTPPSIRLRELKKEQPSKEREMRIFIPKSIKLDKVELKFRTFNTSVETLKSEEIFESTTESSSESEEYELKEFELFDLVFHREGGTLDFDEPLVICLEEPENDSYIGTIRTLCKLIYREKVGGHPEPIIIESLEEFKDELRWIKAEYRIFSVKLSEKEWSELTHEDWTRIWSRIKQLFSQGFGIIILNTSITPIGEHIISIVKLKPKQLPPEVRRKIVELFWGVGLSKDEEMINHFDLLFEIARKKKDKLLKSLEKLEEGIYWDATREDENESKEHRLVKVFIVRLIVKELREKGLKLNTPTEIEEYVKTEYWVSDNTRADVYVDGKVFEIETLFAEDRGGKNIRDKLRETFKKYENTSISEVNIILDNPTFIRHIKIILQLLRNYKDWMKKNQKTVKFYTIDIENERLVSLEEIINKLKYIKQKIKNM